MFFPGGEMPEGMKKAMEQAQARMTRVAIDHASVNEWLATVNEKDARMVELLLARTAAPQMPDSVLLLGMVRMANHVRFGWCLDCGEDHPQHLSDEDIRAGVGLDSAQRTDLEPPADQLSAHREVLEQRPLAVQRSVEPIPTSPTISGAMRRRIARWLAP